MSTDPDHPVGTGGKDSRLAEALARDRNEEDSAAVSSEADYLCIRVGDRLFALLVCHVSEVVTPSTVTPVPHTPAYVPGVLNRHGRVTAVLDLGAFIGDRTEDTPHRIVVLHSGELEAGIPVSEVVGIQPFADDDIHPPLPSMQQIGRFVVGHLVWEDRIFAVVDPARLLDSARPRQQGERPGAVG